MTDGDNHHRPSETSPLLAEDSQSNTQPGSEAAFRDSHDSIDQSHGTFNSHPADADGSTAEQQESSQDQQQKFEGMPEVRKRLKYIAPAVAIGVFLGSADQTIVVASYGKIGSELNALSLTSWV